MGFLQKFARGFAQVGAQTFHDAAKMQMQSDLQAKRDEVLKQYATNAEMRREQFVTSEREAGQTFTEKENRLNRAATSRSKIISEYNDATAQFFRGFSEDMGDIRTPDEKMAAARLAAANQQGYETPQDLMDDLLSTLSPTAGGGSGADAGGGGNGLTVEGVNAVLADKDAEIEALKAQLAGGGPTVQGADISTAGPSTTGNRNLVGGPERSMGAQALNFGKSVLGEVASFIPKSESDNPTPMANRNRRVQPRMGDEKETQLVVGKIYVDSEGNRARWTGTEWEEL